MNQHAIFNCISKVGWVENIHRWSWYLEMLGIVLKVTKTSQCWLYSDFELEVFLFSKYYKGVLWPLGFYITISFSQFHLQLGLYFQICSNNHMQYLSQWQEFPKCGGWNWFIQVWRNKLGRTIIISIAWT